MSAVAQAARLRGAVRLGADRERIRESLARHAPQVPDLEVVAADSGVMVQAAAEARGAAFGAAVGER